MTHYASCCFHDDTWKCKCPDGTRLTEMLYRRVTGPGYGCGRSRRFNRKIVRVIDPLEVDTLRQYEASGDRGSMSVYTSNIVVVKMINE